MVVWVMEKNKARKKEDGILVYVYDYVYENTLF